MKRLAFILAMIPAVASAQNVGATKLISAAPTADTNIYASGDLIGGKLTFTNALRPQVGTGFLVDVTVMDLSAQASDLDLVLFRSDPTATTFTDQAALDIADADASKILTVVNLGSSSRFAFADNGVKHLGSLVIPLRGINSSSGPSGTIYGALISRGTPTFAGAADLAVTLGIAQD